MARTVMETPGNTIGGTAHGATPWKKIKLNIMYHRHCLFIPFIICGDGVYLLQ
jgi:hypothetical protein